MCGRYVVKDGRQVWVQQSAEKIHPNPFRFLDREVAFDGTYNAAPTQQLPVYRVDREGDRRLELFRWGLIPNFVKEKRKGPPVINARAETVATNGYFRSAFRRRRCLVPMNGFYEWAQLPTGKVPHFIHLLNEELFAAAGLYEWWNSSDGSEIQSFTIITFEPNDLVRNTHDRMPAILPPEHYAAWLDPKNEDVQGLQQLLRPYPADEMAAVPVSTRVNSVRNDGPDLVEPATA